MTCCDIFERLHVEENLLRMYQYWTVSLKTRHTTLGSCWIVLKRHADTFSDVGTDEMLELAEVVKDFEKSITAAFACDAIHYLIVPGTYRHFHILLLPRYTAEKDLFGRVWRDTAWPHVPLKEDLLKEEDSEETLSRICNEIQKHF